MTSARTSYQPVRVIGLLLILQVVGLVAIGAYQIIEVDWGQIDWIEINDWDQLGAGSAVQQAGEAVVFVVFFLPPALLLLLAGLSLLLLKRRGWLLAAVAQGLSLGICLFFYSQTQPGFVYPIMVYCILMILYLNSRDVRVVFHSRLVSEERSAEAAHES